MKPEDRQRIERGLRALGISSGDFQAIRTATTLEVAQATLEAVKVKVRKAYKKLALDLHPDRTNGDPEKTDLFRVVTSVKNDIEALTIDRALPPPPPQPMVPVIVIQYNGVGRPPPGHPAANGGVRQWRHGAGSATTTVTMWPAGVGIPRGPKRPT